MSSPLRSLCVMLLVGVMLAFANTSAQPPKPKHTPEELLKKAKQVLAQTEGELKLAGLKEPVEVLRDRWGIAHIYAKNQH
ncbi:MAG: penicillin acylase family protein, partial [Planctomycetia bacterium]|nr:penicillin acylase family protein [Planctomycetia bacterium]